MSEIKLVDFGTASVLTSVRTRGQAAVRLTDDVGRERLRVEFGSDPSARVFVHGPGAGWDLSDRISVDLEIENVGTGAVALQGWLNDKDWMDGFAVLEPGESDTLGIVIKRHKYYQVMKGVPGGHVGFWEEADPKHIATISLATVDATRPSIIEIKSIRAVGDYIVPPEEGVRREQLPLVDRYGQYKHIEWPGKTHTDSDFATQIAREEEDLSAHAGPEDWDRYGGWAKGPSLDATGHFRVAKHEGKWWLVDPEGRLFWSHGIDCVRMEERTPVAGREDYFEGLDARFLIDNGYNFVARNLERKYGGEWEQAAVALAHRRLRSWGMNTVANWSDNKVCLARKTPYVVAIHYQVEELESFSYEDVEAFQQTLRGRLAKEKGKTAEDPWCIGYFIDNELRWPEGDCSELADTYYRICLEEMRRAAPKKLYLGSRLHGHMSPYGGAEEIVRAAAKYCDIVGVNRYRHTPSDLRLPEGMDKPLIVGEFHFGALDRGLLHTGLRSVASQRQRAATYRHYLRQALLHPHIVGAHWFQYTDQPTTGRFDGENYQIGFVDICDTPYWEAIEAAREVGYGMYEVREMSVA